MNDLLAGIGMALVIEGVLWAVAPEAARRMVHEIAGLAVGRIQLGALATVAAGVFVVWLARG